SAELGLFHKSISEALAPFGIMQCRIEEVWRSLGSLKTPWLDTLDAPRSIRGLAGLAALGTAAHIAPFDPVTIQTVRSSLGRWTSIPTEAEEDSLKREKFYEQHGLDTNLIAIPEPAFTEALETTGIVNVELLSPDVDRIEFDVEQQELTPEEAPLFGRMARAASLLQVFEFKLREYLHRVMTERCGNDWEKARSPENGAAYQRWKEKRERAVRNGEEALDLIYYADFTDYANMITRRDNWREVFSAVFLDQTDVQVSFRRLEPLRVPAMHSRPLNKTDLLTIGTETTRILTAIGVLRRQ
ncbi:MAG: Swt1 family HEPN domain-containing protein, partial [Bryobacteraceae bacterium]